MGQTGSPPSRGWVGYYLDVTDGDGVDSWVAVGGMDREGREEESVERLASRTLEWVLGYCARRGWRVRVRALGEG